jgi:hypothetical protein
VALPTPEPGLVIRYSYLWSAEHREGKDEGVKDRPCAVILVTEDEEQGKVVTVLPITHTPPGDEKLALEIPAATKKRLGLDDNPSWIVLTEANRFIWPGPDLRPSVAGDLESVAYGELPEKLFFDMRNKFIAILKAKQAKLVARSG